MAKAELVKKRECFGTVAINHFGPQETNDWPKAINIRLSFEEALKLHLGLGHILQHLNTYNRATTAGRGAAVNLCVFTRTKQITIMERRLK